MGTHFIIGRDMAGTKSTLTSDDFYGAFEAQEMGKKHSAELEMTVVDYPNMVYVGEEHGNARGYTADKSAKEKGLKIQKLSGTEFRKRLRSGDEIPEWFAFPSVVNTLREGGDAIFLWGCVYGALINSYLLALCCDCACTRLLTHVLMHSRFSHEQVCSQICARSTVHLVDIVHFDAMLLTKIGSNAKSHK